MSAITKERIELFIKNPLENGLTRGEQMELARIALASLESEAAKAVPEEMTPQQASRSYGGEVRGYRDGWNDCRAAMLQAGDSTVIPDGWALVPKEITCAMDDAAWEAYHETRCMSDIWAALIAAAPKHGVNRG